MSANELTAVIPPGSDELDLVAAIDFGRLPRHVAVIMDGNGRWARQRRMRRVEGHRAGIASVREVVETAARMGIDVLTVYAFSIENWKRPRAEITALMTLLKTYLRKEIGRLLENGIRFQVLGRMHDLPRDVQDELSEGMERSAKGTGLLFNIALNYGGRTEIVDAVRGLVREGVGADEIDEAAIASHLYSAGLPDPDLLIRTSGELRVSNFLLWQIAYAEIWVTDVLWPDFRRRHLLEAVIDFQRRDRRYGGLSLS